MTLSTLTKFDTLTSSDRYALTRTPLGHTWDDDPTPCNACGIPLATEADFARHFVVADPRYLNLGDCPIAVAARALAVPVPVRPGILPLVSLVKHTYTGTAIADLPADAYRWPEHDVDCPGCESDGWTLRDRAHDTWLQRVCVILDLAYSSYGPAPRFAGDDADVHVTVYDTDRANGGPEEGGWYYDTGTVVWSYRAGSNAAADVIAATVAAVLWPDTGTAGNSNYRGGDHAVTVTSAPGADYPAHAPRYE